MKTFQIEIDPGSLTTFFPEHRIKEKLNLIEILLESIRYILIAERKNKVRVNNKIIFHKEKMSRIFFVSKYKTYSIRFPFNLLIEGEDISINYKNLIDLNSSNISQLITFFKNFDITTDNCFDFAEQVIDFQDGLQENYWLLIRELLLLEDGYIRYDHDDKAYQEAVKKNQKHRHPLHHLDIFYSSEITFKLGFNSAIDDKEIIDTLNTETNCKYLINYR